MIPGLSDASRAGLAGFILLRFLMGLSQCGNYTAGIKALAGLFPGGQPCPGRRVLQRRRAVRLGDRAADRRVPRGAVRLAHGLRDPRRWPGLIWLLPWLAIFPDKQTMTAIAIKPAGAPMTTAPAIGAAAS